MQPKFLALIATLAPLPAAAFGDLDCISFESCGNGGCGPVTEPFSVDFNWADEQAIVTKDGTGHALPWTETGETDNGLASVLEYGDPAPANRRLRIEASGTNITAYYTFPQSGWTTWVGTCDVRKAA